MVLTSTCFGPIDFVFTLIIYSTISVMLSYISYLILPPLLIKSCEHIVGCQIFKSYWKLNRSCQLIDWQFLHSFHDRNDWDNLLVIHHLPLSHHRKDEDIANFSATLSIEKLMKSCVLNSKKDRKNKLKGAHLWALCGGWAKIPFPPQRIVRQSSTGQL